MVLNFARLLADLWNKIKPGSSALTPDISEDDIVVFVVGPTGSGKSWFTKEATRSDLVNVSRDYHPFTGKVQAIRCELTDEARKDLQEGIKGIVFIDTPAFLTGCDHIDAHGEIKAWIDRTKYQPPRHVGVIYMHRVETDPGLEPIKNHLQEFTSVPRIGGGHFPQRVHIVVSYDKTSGNVAESKISERRSKLRTQMDFLNKTRWQPSLHQALFQGEPEVAWRAVEELFRN